VARPPLNLRERGSLFNASTSPETPAEKMTGKRKSSEKENCPVGDDRRIDGNKNKVRE